MQVRGLLPLRLGQGGERPRRPQGQDGRGSAEGAAERLSIEKS